MLLITDRHINITLRVNVVQLRPAFSKPSFRMMILLKETKYNHATRTTGKLQACDNSSTPRLRHPDGARLLLLTSSAMAEANNASFPARELKTIISDPKLHPHRLRQLPTCRRKHPRWMLQLLMSIGIKTLGLGLKSPSPQTSTVNIHGNRKEED